MIEQTIREKLPEGFQRAEYLHAKGMVDKVVPRAELKPTIASILRIMTKAERRALPKLNGAAKPNGAARAEANGAAADD